MRIPLIGLALIGLSCAVACTVVTTTTPNPNAQTTKDGGSTAANDGGNTATDGGTAGGAANAGSITLTQTKTSAGGQDFVNYSASASFAKVEGAGGTGGATGCTTKTEGTCVVMECDLTQGGGNGGGGATPKIVYVSAGDITVKATEEITLPVTGENKYDPKTDTKELFVGGEDIKVTGKGATIPAFDSTLKAPATVTLTVPEAPAAGAKLEVDSAAAFELEWTDGGDGNVSATLSTIKTGEKSVTISCSFPSKDNKGTIPAAAVAKLIKGAPLGTYSVGASSATTAKAGDWTVSISASAGGASGLIDVQ